MTSFLVPCSLPNVSRAIFFLRLVWTYYRTYVSFALTIDPAWALYISLYQSVCTSKKKQRSTGHMSLTNVLPVIKSTKFKNRFCTELASLATREFILYSKPSFFYCCWKPSSFIKFSSVLITYLRSQIILVFFNNKTNFWCSERWPAFS